MGRQGGCVSGARTPAHTRGHRGRPRCPRLAAAAAAPRLTTSPSPQLCQDGVGRCLLAAAAAVPGGVLAFFPSYSLLGRLVDRWRGTGAWRALGAATTPVVEPRGSGPGFADALAEYYAAVEGGGRAMFLAVCRGKASRQGTLRRGGGGAGARRAPPPTPPPHHLTAPTPPPSHPPFAPPPAPAGVRGPGLCGRPRPGGAGLWRALPRRPGNQGGREEEGCVWRGGPREGAGRGRVRRGGEACPLPNQPCQPCPTPFLSLLSGHSKEAV